MGGVELLSREGEIAIAKRIEAGKDVMTDALTQSPILRKKISEWQDLIENNNLLVRDIVDIDSTYEDFESDENESEANKKSSKNVQLDEKNKNGDQPKDQEETTEEDEFNMSLAKMEEEIRPKVLNILTSLNKNYLKLQKYQKEKLECILAAKDLSISKNKNFKRIQSILIEDFKKLQLAPHIIDELVQSHYKENKKIISLEGVLLRLAIDNKISRDEFLKYYINNEINPKFETFLTGKPNLEKFF